MVKKDTENDEQDVEVVDEEEDDVVEKTVDPVATEETEISDENEESDQLEDIADPLESATSDIVRTEKVVEGTEEEGESAAPQYASPNANKAMSIMNLDGLIKRYLVDIDKLKEQLKTQRDMFEDSFNGDKQYHEEAEKVKAANKLKQAARQRILKQPNVAIINDRINAIREDIKDAQDVLNGYVADYLRLAGTNQIVNDDGSILEIVSTTKLVRKSKFRP